MEETRDRRCATIGTRVSLLCATLAVSGPLVFTIPNASDLPRYTAATNLTTVAGIAFILAAFYTSAAFLGRAAGKNICRRRHDLGGAVGLGIGVALGSLLVGAVAVDLSVFLAQLLSGHRESFGLLTALIILFGALPALLLGVLYGVLVRWRLTKAGCLE